MNCQVATIICIILYHILMPDYITDIMVDHSAVLLLSVLTHTSDCLKRCWFNTHTQIKSLIFL